MYATSKLSSNGRVTIPNDMRDALGLEEGDMLLFQLEGLHVTISKVNDFIEMAGSVPVPPEKRGKPWKEILRETYANRYAGRYGTPR